MICLTNIRLKFFNKQEGNHILTINGYFLYLIHIQSSINTTIFLTFALHFIHLVRRWFYIIAQWAGCLFSPYKYCDTVLEYLFALLLRIVCLGVLQNYRRYYYYRLLHFISSLHHFTLVGVNFKTYSS